MALYNEEREGFRPQVTPTGGGSQIVDWSPEPSGFSQASGILSTILQTMEAEEVKKQKKQEEKFDMYKTLREAGYDPRMAWDAMQRGDLPSEPPSSAAADTKAAADLAETQARTKKLEAETENLKGSAAPPNAQPGEPFVKANGKWVKNPAYTNPQRGTMQEFNATTKVRQEFLNRPEVKDYIETSTNVKAMEGMYRAAVTGSIENQVALDQGLITMYNKLTDPQSVVRESEYARTPQNLPVVNRIVGAIEKLKKGGAGLTNDDREALVLGAKIIMKERGRTYNQTLKEYRDLSAGYNFEPEIVTRGAKAYMEEFNSVEEAIASGLPGGTEVLINGERAILEDDEEEEEEE